MSGAPTTTVLLAVVVLATAKLLDSAGPEAPAFTAVRSAYRPSDLRLLDRHGETIQEQRVDREARRLAWVGLEQMSPALVEAVIQTEDRHFYRHSGVDGGALLAAGVDWLTGRSRRGGSTITMQLVGMLDSSMRSRRVHRSLQQKWRQVWAARHLELSWSKDEILEAYLNLATFRGEIQGIGAAAELLFGKQPHGLSVAESQVLAALLKGPNADHDLLVRRAFHSGSAPDGEIAAALQHVTSPGDPLPRDPLAPHLARRLLRGQTHDILSTLDARIQLAAVDSLRQNLMALRQRHVADGAVLVADNASGEVLAYVGGIPGLSSATHVDGVRAPRQAGSTLKPFLYALAIEQHLLTAASLLEDTPLEISVAGGLYRPRDYDGIYRGSVTVRNALAGSLNVPAVRTLLLVGADSFATRLRLSGFSGVSEAGDYYGPSLALGSADVTLWELVNGFRTLANHGRHSPLLSEPSANGVNGIKDGSEPVFAAAAAFVTADILADRESRAATFGIEGPLATRYWSAVKTGTSKEMRDNWCIGFSQCYTVGVWVGNLNGDPMHDVSGIAGAAPVWRDVMDLLNVSCAADSPSPPADVRDQIVAAGAVTSGRRNEWFLVGTEPSVMDTKPRLARIAAPVEGTIVAVDPDIPQSNQRVIFEAEGERGDLRWQLDSGDLGEATELVPWLPQPGRHRLALVDRRGLVADSIEFLVRGQM